MRGRRSSTKIRVVYAGIAAPQTEELASPLQQLQDTVSVTAGAAQRAQAHWFHVFERSSGCFKMISEIGFEGPFLR
jgi:hypothetical protein